MKLWVTRTTIITLIPSFFFGIFFAANDCIYWLLDIGYVEIWNFLGWIGARVREISGASYMSFLLDFQSDSIHHV